MNTAGTQFPMLNKVEAYWHKLRGERPVPPRSEIDPRQLGTALSACFILERLAPGVARFRLAGMQLNDLMGMEVRGMPLTSMFLPRTRNQVGEAMEQVFDTPAVARLTLAGDRAIGKPPLDAALLLLPLTSDLGEVTRVLGYLPSLGPVGRTPRRFDVTECRVTPVVPSLKASSMETNGWHEAKGSSLEGMLDGLSESAATFKAAPARMARPSRSDRPHLYLVKTDED